MRRIHCIMAQKKFWHEIRYSARTRVIIDEKSVRMVQRMKNPAARKPGNRLGVTGNRTQTTLGYANGVVRNNVGIPGFRDQSFRINGSVSRNRFQLTSDSGIPGHSHRQKTQKAPAVQPRSGFAGAEQTTGLHPRGVTSRGWTTPLLSPPRFVPARGRRDLVSSIRADRAHPGLEVQG